MPFIFKKIYFFRITELTKSVNGAIINLSKNQGGVRLELTKSEMEIMDVLWGAEKPLSRADLLARSEEKTWKRNHYFGAFFTVFKRVYGVFKKSYHFVRRLDMIFIAYFLSMLKKIANFLAIFYFFAEWAVFFPF